LLAGIGRDHGEPTESSAQLTPSMSNSNALVWGSVRQEFPIRLAGSVSIAPRRLSQNVPQLSLGVRRLCLGGPGERAGELGTIRRRWRSHRTRTPERRTAA
jgi:hypothetical protein